MDKLSQALDRMQHLISYGVNESAKPTNNNTTPILEYTSKGADGKTYAIGRHCNKFYLMVAPPKDTQLVAEDFDYLGGFANRKQHEYRSYTQAMNHFDLKMKSIRESVGIETAQPARFTTQKPAEWQINETVEMRDELNRFNEIMGNVAYIMKEDKNNGFTMNHTLPEAPAQNPSDKKVAAPFTDTAVAKGDKDFKETSSDPTKEGAPYDKDAKVTNADMQSDKKPSESGDDAVYTEKPKYGPKDSVADQNPSGGKVTRADEGKKHRTVIVTEQQAMAWCKDKDFLDTSKGTEIGSSEPFTQELGDESNQCEANTEPIHEECGGAVHNNDNQNCPTPGTSETGDDAPFTQKVNEDAIDADDVAGLPDDGEEDYDFPFDVAGNDLEDDGAYADFERDYNDWLNDEESGDTMLSDDDFDFDDDTVNMDFVRDNAGGIEDYDLDLNSRQRRGKKVNEGELNLFGKHPAYRKTPMTLPTTDKKAPNGAEDWNDDSVKSEKPFGSQIGSGAPFDEKVVNMITDQILKKLGFSKKA